MLRLYAVSLAMALFICLLGGTAVLAEDGQGQSALDIGKVLDQQISKLDVTEIRNFLNALDQDTKRLIPEFNLRQLATGEGIRQLDPRRYVSAALEYLVREVVANGRLMGELLVVGVLASLMQSMNTAFAGETANETAYLVCYLVLVLISVKSFFLAIGVAKAAITAMSSFVIALIPLLFTMLVAMGGVASAAIMHPVVVMVASGVGGVVNGFVFPLLFLYATLGIISNMSGKAQLTKLASLSKDASVAVLGACLTFFIGTITVKGLAGPGLDGVSIRTSKFLAKAFLPVVGGLFSDAWDAVSGCSLLLKNTIGVFGLIGIASICLFPILKIACLVFVYRAAAAVSQPIADGRIVTMLNDLGTSLLVVMAAVACVGFMFFVSLTIVIGIGSMTMVAR